MNTNPYDAASKYYDLIVGSREDEVGFIKYQIEKYKVKPGGKLLDLGIGTGEITSEFLNDFETIVGVDLSEAMLNAAASKIENLITINSDISEYYDPKIKYDLVISTMDSVNHLADINKWEKTFKNVSKMLDIDGVFIFDINTLSRLEKLLLMGIDDVETAAGVYSLNVTNEENLYKFNINIDDKSGNISNYDIYETSYPLKEITSLLNRHFNNIEVYKNINGKFTKNNNNDSDKLFIVCSNKTPITPNRAGV